MPKGIPTVLLSGMKSLCGSPIRLDFVVLEDPIQGLAAKFTFNVIAHINPCLGGGRCLPKALSAPVSFVSILRVCRVINHKVSRSKRHTPQTIGLQARQPTAPPTGLEPAYSSYAFNDRLEGGDDTGARYVANFLFRLDIGA